MISQHLVLSTATEVLGYFEPLLSVNEYRSQGIDIAKSAGDVHFACMLKLMYVYCCFGFAVRQLINFLVSFRF